MIHRVLKNWNAPLPLSHNKSPVPKKYMAVYVVNYVWFDV